jgi:hypothetical protein
MVWYGIRRSRASEGRNVDLENEGDAGTNHSLPHSLTNSTTPTDGQKHFDDDEGIPGAELQYIAFVSDVRRRRERR